MSNTSSKVNPIIEVIGDKEVHEYMQVKINLHHSIYGPLIRQAIALNIDVGSLVKLRMGPCQCCGHDKIEVGLNKIPCTKRPFHQTKSKHNPHQTGPEGH